MRRGGAGGRSAGTMAASDVDIAEGGRKIRREGELHDDSPSSS